MAQPSFFGSQSLCQTQKQQQSSFDAFIFSSSPRAIVPSARKFVEIEESSPSESKQKRKRSKACERCKRFKLKCDVGRPCKNCMAKGCGKQCTDELVSEENAIVEAAKQVKNGLYMMVRPIGFQGRMIELPREPSEVLPQTKNEYLTRLIGGGVLIQLKAARELVESLTPDISDSLIAGIEALQLVHTGHSTVQGLKEHRGRSRAVVQNKHSRGRVIRILDDDYSEHACFVEIGHLKDLTYPPTFSFNRKCAELMGIDPDELLTRAARSDLTLPCPEIEFLACMIDAISGIPSGGRNVYTRWQRGFWSGKPDTLFIEMKSDIKVVGEELIQETIIMPISPEEYENARASCPARCRPILSAMGDTRNASDLLRDVDKDNRQTLRSLRKTPDGRRQLQAMASEIKYRFAPIISAASAIPRSDDASSPTAAQPDMEPYTLPSPGAVSSMGSPGTPGAFVDSPTAEAAWSCTEALEPCTSSASSGSSDWSSQSTVAKRSSSLADEEGSVESEGGCWGAEVAQDGAEPVRGPVCFEGMVAAAWRPGELPAEHFGSLTEEEVPAIGREDSGWMEGFVFHGDSAVKAEPSEGRAHVVRIDEEESATGRADTGWGGFEGLSEGGMCFEGTQGHGSSLDGGMETWWGSGMDLIRAEGVGFEAGREVWGSMSSEPLGA